MKAKVLKTKSGHITHCVFVDTDDGNHYCFSYDQLVAAIIDGVYVEYDGEQFFSNTSCRHKARFRQEYGAIREVSK